MTTQPDQDYVFPTPEQAEVQRNLTELARQAIQANRNFLANANPTAAQSTAQVKALTRQTNALIRLQFGQLDTTD